MATLPTLLTACKIEQKTLMAQAQQRIASWENWLTPISTDNPSGEDPSYDDDFQLIRTEVNKLSGANVALICQLAEKIVVGSAKDIRIVTYYTWARLHRDGEAGLADGLELLAGLLQRFNTQLHPYRVRSRKAAIEWLASNRMIDSISLYPEVSSSDTLRLVGALLLITQITQHDSEPPQLEALYSVLESRLVKAGGVEAVVPQTAADNNQEHVATGAALPALTAVASGRDLLDQARMLASYLREQPNGWLAAHRLMKCLRHDTLHQLPPLNSQGLTRIDPPKPDNRALLKRLYLQQSWQELLEQADNLFSRGANHFWLDIQWYTYQGLLKSGREVEAAIIKSDLKGLLNRLLGLKALAFNDGTPFADENTLHWIDQEVVGDAIDWQDESTLVALPPDQDSILMLEAEAVKIADSEGADAALNWLQNQPAMTTVRQQWLLRLVMVRLAEQIGKSELALYLLSELDRRAAALTLAEWEPEILFEIKARRLRLLRTKIGRSEADRPSLQTDIARLLADLIAIDPARAAVLCG